MQLARMQDIGGCRAVVRTTEEADAMAEDLLGQRKWKVIRHYDYIRDPKPDGYRARHLIVEKRGQLIEVQLRTVSQHAWAELIEAADRDLGLQLKGGQGPPELREYYSVGASLLALSDRGETVDKRTVRRFQELHRRVFPYLGRRTT